MAKKVTKLFLKNADKDGVNRIKERFPEPQGVDARTNTPSYKKSLKNLKRNSYQPNERTSSLPGRLKIKRVQKENAFDTAEYLRKEDGQNRKALNDIAKETESGSYSRKISKAKPQKIKDIKLRMKFNKGKLAEREQAGKEKRATGQERMMSRKESAMLRYMKEQVKSEGRGTSFGGGGSGSRSFLFKNTTIKE